MKSKGKINRPLLVNHKNSVDNVRSSLISRLETHGDYGQERWDAKIVPNIADAVGFTDKVQTVKQRDNKYTRQNFYGVELEMSSDYTPAELYTRSKYPFFIVKGDSSVSGKGKYNYELVSLPMTLKAHKILWAGLFKELEKTSPARLIDKSLDNSNGIHVHIDKENFIDERHKRNFLWFMHHPAHVGYLFDISERDKWRQFVDYSPIRITGPRGDWWPRGHGKVDIAKHINTFTKGRSVAHVTQKTIEVRIFKGIASPAQIIKALEFIDSLVEYSKERSIIQMDFHKYTAWLKKETMPNQYCLIKQFLNNHIEEDSHSEYKIVTALFKHEIQDLHLKVPMQKPKRTDLLNRFSTEHGGAGPLLVYDNKEKTISIDYETLKGKMVHLDNELYDNLTKFSERLVA